MNPVRKIIFTMFAYPILVMALLGFSPQAHSSSVTICPCNDTKGCGDFARECCRGIHLMCCSSKNPETEAIIPFQGKPPVKLSTRGESKQATTFTPQARPVYAEVAGMVPNLEEMYTPPPAPVSSSRIGHTFGDVEDGIDHGTDLSIEAKQVSNGHTGHTFGVIKKGLRGNFSIKSS